MNNILFFRGYCEQLSKSLVLYIMSWFPYDALKRYWNKFWNQQEQLEEPTVTYSIGNKRINEENINENSFIKRRKLSSSSDAGFVHIDLTDSQSDTNLPHIMPKRNKKAKNKRAGVKNNDNVETIEIIDDDDNESPDAVQSTSNDVEVVEDVSAIKNLNKNIFSPSDNDKMGKDNPASKYESARDASNVKSYLSFSSIRPSNNSRIQRHRVESRTLKELNNRSVLSNGYPSETYKKSAALTSPTSSSRAVTRSFSDRLILSSLKKKQNRSAFMDALKKYAISPNIKRSSVSPKSLLFASSPPPRSAFDSGSSDRTFGTFQSQRSTPSLDPIKANNSLEISPSPRYLTRFQNSSLSNRSLLVPAPKPSSSMPSNNSDTSAINRTVIDLTSEEDDESQRQEIISNVVASDYIRNLKTSYIGKGKTITDPDYIHNLLKKYEAAFKSNDLKAQKIRQQIRERSNDLNKTISEIFEKRLILKEQVEEEEPKPAFELAPITKAMGDAINQIVASKKVPLVQVKDTSVKLQDIKTLENCAWLNDEVINAYMNLIKMRAEKKPDKYPKVHCFNTFLYEQLQKKGYNSVRRWTKKIDIFDFTMLIIPIHLGNHWCLIQIKIKEKCIRYFDSMGSPNNHCLKSMMQYLVDEFKDKKNGDLDAEKWQLINMPPSEIPQQRNMHDCGVFACTFAEHLTRQAPLNFSQDNMPYFRVKMMYEILTAELLL